MQPVKLQRCRDLPNLWNLPEFSTVRLGRPKAVGPEDDQQIIGEVADRFPLERDVNLIARDAQCFLEFLGEMLDFF